LVAPPDGSGAPANQLGGSLRRVRISRTAVADVASTMRLTDPEYRAPSRVDSRQRRLGSVTGRVTGDMSAEPSRACRTASAAACHDRAEILTDGRGGPPLHGTGRGHGLQAAEPARWGYSAGGSGASRVISPV
jgi:hypothetical protein